MRMALATTLAILVLVPIAAQAGETPWLNRSAFSPYLKNHHNGGKVIPTDIDCRVRGPDLQVKLSYVPLGSMQKPFHKWSYVIARESEVGQRVASLKRSDRFDLEYKIVMQDSVTVNGERWLCVVAFR